MAFIDLEDSKGKGKKDLTPTPLTRPAPVEEPGWFEPGSKSEAAVRGFSNAATLGLAPKISAGIRSLTGAGEYKDLLSEYLAADRAAQAAQPGASLAGNLVGAAPSLIATGGGGLASQVAKNAALGGLNAYGSSEESGVGLLKDVGTGAGIAGGLTAAVPMAGKVIKGATNVVRGTPDKGKIAEAAGNFVSRTEPMLVGDKAQRSAIEQVWSKLGLEDIGMSRQAFEDAVSKDPTIINKLANDPKALETIITQHNKSNTGGRYTKIAKDVAIGAGGGGVTGFVGSGGDLDATMTAAQLGAAGGLATGARRALTGPNAKLRVPGVAEDTTPLSSIGQAAQTATNVAKTAAIQAASKDLSEVTGTSTTPFGKLTNFLAQANGSNNPAVNQQAALAQRLLETSDPEEKRKLVMQMQATPEGRAVGNSDSPVRK